MNKRISSTASLNIENNISDKVCTSNVEALLMNIPADVPRNEWIQVAAGLKNIGKDFSVFDQWSQKSIENKYDASDAKRVWEDVCAEGKPEVTLKTIKYLADKYKDAFIPLPQEMLSAPTTPEEQALQVGTFIDLLFKEGEFYEFVSSVRTDAKGKTIPDRTQSQIQSRESTEITAENLARIKEIVTQSLDGAWVSLNPVKKDFKGKAPGDADVTEYRHALIEADDLSKEEQWKLLKELNLPIKAVVWSGGKSLHAIVKIDAGNDFDLYRERVAALHRYLAEQNFPVDPANKNPSRLTRIPGFRRGNEMQYLVSQEFGPKTWNDFEKFFLKNKAKADRRAISSPENGQKGWRPFLPVTDYAKAFLNENTNSGELALRFVNSSWWGYNGRTWQEISEDDLDINITHFLQQNSVHEEGRISTSVINDTKLNLKGLCGLVDCKMPCWLPSGEDASDIICFRNGMLSIDKLIAGEEQTLRPLSPSYFGSHQVEYDYLPEAECPMWHEYLQTTFNDEESRQALQMMFGYILSGKIDKNIGFFQYGRGGDGKSVATHILGKLYGESQTCCLPFANLGEKHSTHLLTEHKLNLVEETPVSCEIRNISDAEKMFKMVTDGAMIPIEPKFVNPKMAPAIARCVFNTNELPSFVDRSNGLWDRLVILHFPNRIRDTDNEKPNLKKDLEKELPGIFLWAVEGARELREHTRFPLPPTSRAILQNHRLACDHEAEFFAENVIAIPGSYCSRGKLYSTYKIWATDNGYSPKGRGKFNAAVKVRFPDVEETRIRTPRDLEVWAGITYADCTLMLNNNEDEAEGENA
ncbi:MAG: PriCT-2 domain-containing protein [Lentisphaeria bacterium]|nr:PriCT-2 domain-containing protein [Lentisphaeria bacterium]